MSPHRFSAGVTSLALIVGALLIPSISSAAAAPSCAGAVGGGEWTGFGGDVQNTRNQSLTHDIDASNASDLQKKWAFTPGMAEGGGNFQSTPAVVDGCMYVATGSGWVFSLNADTGEVVWKAMINDGAANMFAVSVAYDRVYAFTGIPDGAMVVALDQATGDVLFSTKLMDEDAQIINASPVVFNKMIFLGAGGGDATDNSSRPPYFIVDAITGEILIHNHPISVKDNKKGYGGGGIWATGVVDPKTNYLYAGTANPYSKRLEHKYTNAILKIDVDRGRNTFGDVVDHYKGTVDSYYPGIDQNPACQQFGDLQPVGFSVVCLQLDVDFGASPNLFTNDKGRTIVGSLQKSGIYHAVDARTMKPIWTALLSVPLALGNAGTSAVDDKNVYVAVSPGVMYALDKNTGETVWTTPMPDGTHYETVSVSNGVVYGVDTKGVLNLFDAETGTPLTPKPLSADAGEGCTSLSGGVAIARERVYATCDVGSTGGWIISYGLDR